MAELSPATQNALIAFYGECFGPGLIVDACQAWTDDNPPCNFACDTCLVDSVAIPYRRGLAAALRAAALYCKRDNLILLALADELEGQ